MHSFSLDLMHLITSYLLQPVIWGLLFFIALSIYEIGLAIGERFSVISSLVKGGHKQQLIEQGKRRIERADFITRIAPMLGLMGTLIPLGPGLSALGTGDISVLTTAMTVAFDTTIIGLLAGVIGFVLGRMRRRWYDNAMVSLSLKNADKHLLSNHSKQPVNANKVDTGTQINNDIGTDLTNDINTTMSTDTNNTSSSVA
jgi:biopolymer transport protein ExbB/TolQ